MKFGILGSGAVGQSLGRGFVRNGHEVRIGTRDTGKADLREWLDEAGDRGSVGTFGEAAAHGEVVLLCTNGAATEAAIDLAGPANFGTKVVIDVTNPLDFSNGMPPSLLYGVTDSLGERVQRKLPSARVVKCFNIVNNETMIEPKMEEGLPDMILCGNDPEAKRVVAGILRELGWGDPIDIGGIDGSRWLEAFTILWVRLAMSLDNWRVAIRVLRS